MYGIDWKYRMLGGDMILLVLLVCHSFMCYNSKKHKKKGFLISDFFTILLHDNNAKRAFGIILLSNSSVAKDTNLRVYMHTI